MAGTSPETSRETDWRFLLPTADPGGLRVAPDPGPKELEHAFSLLQPGGACYFEWSSRLRPSANALRRKLEAAGFADVRLYWSWPPDTPSVWIPLEEPATARWVLRRRHTGLVRGLWHAGKAARLLRPRCATAVRPPVAANVGPFGISLDGVGPDPFWALLAPGSDPLNKVLAFVGVRGRDAPSLVLKMPRTPAAVAPLEREAAALQALHSSGRAPAGVPRLLSTHRDGAALRAIAESPLEGRPLFELLDHSRHPQLARQATEWLVDLARVPPQPTEPRPRVLDLAREAAAAAAPGDRELLLETGRLAARADVLPVVFEQRDFSPWNVHVGRDGDLVVFDWESAERSGFPALDLVYLLAYCGFFLDRALQSGRLRESYRATFEDEVAAGCLTRYCSALGIGLDRLGALRALTWLVHVRAALLRDPAGFAAAPFFDLLREEVR